MINQLSKAIFEDNLSLVNSLIQNGADLNLVDDVGQTALMHAVGQENIRLVELFVSLGADINIKGHGGFTALHHAVDTSIDGTIQSGGKVGEEPLVIIQTLLKNGADLSAVTNNNQTPFDIANSYNCKKVAECLVSNPL